MNHNKYNRYLTYPKKVIKWTFGWMERCETHSVTDKKTGSERGSQEKGSPGHHHWLMAGLGKTLHL